MNDGLNFALSRNELRPEISTDLHKAEIDHRRKHYSLDLATSSATEGRSNCHTRPWEDCLGSETDGHRMTGSIDGFEHRCD
jgi:hypothetical protein